MIKRDELSLQHDLIQISELVMEIYRELRRGSEAADSFENMITPYRLVASAAQAVRDHSKQKLPDAEMRGEGMQSTINTLEGRVANLDRYHRAARVIGLIEVARRRKVVQEEVERLKILVDIEEIDVVPGDELRHYTDLSLEVTSSDGDGVRSVISEVVEPGYRTRATGVVIKQPRVRVRFED